ncbi:MAG TPA: peroxidase [Oscillatoriaceae cyanobacterium M33_DOE_052]|uniref:Peroxidase n=1 Tax=Planktothricoides sp. SpSt-374 TaxID=2282167 RepID=A0A7C3VRB1_9CYAN|nr:peroxidase [Oscillatoriaceae cyanobacterium M33_DOE_052]
MSIDLTQTNIDPKDPQYQGMLEDLQENILKSHEKNYYAHIFLQFNPDPEAAKKWIRQFASAFVRSAKQQLEAGGNLPEKNNNGGGGISANFMLSYSGYQALGFDLVAGGSREFPSAAFKVGMQRFGKILKDPPLPQWQAGFQQQIHGLIMLGDNDLDNLQKQAIKIGAEVKIIAKVVNTEVGMILKNSKGEAIEHFGFRDGVSQPLFLKGDIEAATAQGFDKWNPSAPLKLLLVKDPLGKGEDSYGSYCVYRKLQQDVQGFRTAEKNLAEKLCLSGKDAERAGALAIGRFRDGTPVVLAASEQNAQPVPNNFNYDDDVKGSKCPFHAHIRKANPRGDKNDRYHALEDHRQHRIVRRAVSYGEMPETRDNSLGKMEQFQKQLAHLQQMKLQPAAGENVGLLFIGFQSDIFDQFMFIQKNWANHQQFVTYTTGLDAVIGQGNKQDPSGQKWPTEWGKDEEIEFDFYNFVTLKGGEFLFAPSISFLKNI